MGKRPQEDEPDFGRVNKGERPRVELIGDEKGSEEDEWLGVDVGVTAEESSMVMLCETLGTGNRDIGVSEQECPKDC